MLPWGAEGRIPADAGLRASRMSQSLRRIALIVAVATALSKVAGLVRQQVIAAAFGVGVAYDAFTYA